MKYHAANAAQLRQENRAFVEPVPRFRVREEIPDRTRARGDRRGVGHLLRRDRRGRTARLRMSGQPNQREDTDLDRPFEEIRAIAGWHRRHA